MSHIAQGTIMSTSPIQFIASFIIPENNLQLSFLANCDSPLPSFSSRNGVTLKYDNLQQLSGFNPFSGTFREVNFTINTANGPVISGVLETPLADGVDIVGVGMWKESNE